MAYFLAVDQGSTKTVAVAGDELGNILGMGYAGGACHSIDGMEIAMGMVKQACDQAMGQAGITAAEVRRLVGGLTGADWEHEYKLLEDALVSTLGIPLVEVHNDCVIAQRGGTDAAHSVVLCAGTAFNAAVQKPDGSRMIFGYYVNDEDMGGTSLGKAAIVAVCNAHAGIGPETGLTGAVLGFYGLASVDDLLFRRINRQLGPYKNAAPLLFDQVKQGDQAAIEIVEKYGRSVTRYAVAGVRLGGGPAERTDVVLSGSIFKAEDRTLQRVIAAGLASEAPRADVVDALYEPVAGAYLFALDDFHGFKFPMRSENLLRSAARYDLIRLSSEKRKVQS